MGNSPKKGSSTNSSSSSSEHQEMPSEKDIELIKQSWDSIENKEEFGITIMIRIFTAHSEIKNKWIFATNLETEAEMLSNSQLRYHAKKVIDVLTKLLTTVFNNPADLDESALIRLGRSHYHYGVVKEDFTHFEESFFYSLKKHVNDKKLNYSKVEKSWRKVYLIIVNKLAEGIELEMDEKGI